jgi:hypothetical protein
MTEQSERKRQATSDFIREVRARIWTWDPAGLAEVGAPDDEYDCLVGPVTGGLREGLSPEALADRLRRFVLDDFAMEPNGTEAFASDLVEWYQGLGRDAIFG